MGTVLSLGQDPRWRRFLASRVHAIPGSWVLDVASGTGLVARELAGRNLRVVALDQSAAMIARGRSALVGSPLQDRICFVLGRSERLPFPDETFDALTFTYLLRYVDDPQATLAELARVVRPGGAMASLEFHVPDDRWLHVAWLSYTRGIMPAIGWARSNEWYRAARFLGPSISAFSGRYPLPVQVAMWQRAGMRHVRTRTLSMGAAVVTYAVKRTAVADG